MVLKERPADCKGTVGTAGAVDFQDGAAKGRNLFHFCMLSDRQLTSIIEPVQSVELYLT